MADIDSRRDYRGGGGFGGRGGGGKRKRYREDDDNERDYRNQRRRPEAPPGTRIRRSLLELAEDVDGRPPRNTKEPAHIVGKLAAENWDDEYVRDMFGAVTTKLVVEQPLKIPFVAGVVLYANAEKSEVGQDMIGHVKPMLQEALDAGNWRAFKLVLRFLACLAPMLQEDGVMPILDELFNRAVDLQTASSEDALGIELVKIILLTIPYLLAASSDTALQQRASELLEKTDIVATAPHALEALVDPYTPSEDEQTKPMAFGTFISLLQRQLQAEAGNGWKLTCIPRVYDPTMQAKNEDGADGEAVSSASSGKHAFPIINVPTSVSAGSRLMFPEVYFSVYADQEIQSVPPTSNIGSCLVRDGIVDSVNILDFNRNAVAKLLTEMDNFWAPGAFARRETPFDRLRDYPSNISTWKPEDVGIDAVFSQILLLPAPEHRLVYYHSIITELCKISPAAIAPSLGRAIRFLYRSLEHMDLELAYRFMDWFAHHLSNFEFRWKWTEWVPEVTLPDIHPRKAFINGALDKEIRLSFAKRIRGTLPEAFHPLIPDSKEKDIPDYKYNDDQTPYAKEGREVLSLLKKKEPETEIQKVLDSVQEQATAHGVADPLVPSTDIYMTAICSIGSKSLSHVLSTVDRCKERLLAVGTQSEPARRQIISAVMDFWSDHPGNAVNIVDKLLNYTIITPMSVIEWALQDRLDRGRSLASAQVYELVSTTMFKVTDRLRQIVEQRNNLAVPFEQRQQIDEVLPRERQSARDMYAAIEDAVAAVASGAQDEMIERFDNDSEERNLIMLWGERWARVWRRKSAVEETVVGEAAIGPLEEPPVVEDAADGADGNAEQSMDVADEIL